MTETVHILSPRAYRLQETAAPATEPVTVDELKTHLRVTGTAEDAALEALITAARLVCEQQSGKFFVSRGVSLFLDAWPETAARGDWWDGAREGVAGGVPACLRLPVSPVGAVEGIYVHPADGAPVAVAEDTYHVDTMCGRIALTGAPPQPERPLNGIEIRLAAGYGAAAVVPAVFKQAIKQVAAHLYTYRGDVPEQAMTRSGAAALIAPYKEVTL